MTENEEMVLSQNLSKNFEQSDFYQKFMKGQKLLNESEDPAIRESMDISTEARFKSSQAKQLVQELKAQNDQLERHIQEQDVKMQALKQQNQNLIKEVDRLQSKESNASGEVTQLRNRILAENNAKNRAIQQLEEVRDQQIAQNALVEEQKLLLNAKVEEIRSHERVHEQYKTELQTLKKKNIQLEELLAEAKAQASNYKEEVATIKQDLLRQSAQLKHMQQENVRLRREMEQVSLNKGQIDKYEQKLAEQRLLIAQLQQDRSEPNNKFKQQLEAANQEINRLMSQNNNQKQYTIKIDSPPKPLMQNWYDDIRDNIAPASGPNDFNTNTTRYDPIKLHQPAPNYYPPNYAQNNHPQQVNPFNYQHPAQPEIQLNNVVTQPVPRQLFQNVDPIQSIEKELMQLQMKKTELEGLISRLDTQKMRTQGQLSRKKNLENELETTVKQIQHLRKELRNVS